MSFTYVYPIQDWNIANQRHSVHHDGTDSVDIAIPSGTPLYAMASGVIAVAYKDHNRNTWGIDSTDPGNCVSIQTEREYITYMHLTKVADNINVGTYVKAGALIGYSGNTGNSSGPHLHIQFRQTPWSGQLSSTISASDVFKDGVTYNVGDIVPRTQLFIRDLAVEKTVSSSEISSNLSPKDQFLKDLPNIPDNAIEPIAALTIRELGYTYDGDYNKGIMSSGVYAKLCRNIYLTAKPDGDGSDIQHTIYLNGGFSGWTGTGGLINYPSQYKNRLLDIVEKNLKNHELYGLEGKWAATAKCFPIQNYGYAGEGYPNCISSIEKELSNKILNRDPNLGSHLSNTRPTRLIRCLGNTGFFTTVNVIPNLASYPENQLLINSANIGG